MADANIVAKEVLKWVTRALQALSVIKSTGWMGEDATRIVGKLSDIGTPIVSQLEGLRDRLEELLNQGQPITLEELEEINDEATAAEDAFMAMLETKVID